MLWYRCPVCFELMPRKLKNPLPSIDLGPETIGSRVAVLRKQAGLTQQQLAQKVGIERTLLASYEVGNNRMYDEMLARIAIALSVSADEILGLKQNSKTDFVPSVRVMRRVKRIESLPEHKQRALLTTIDMALESSEAEDET